MPELAEIFAIDKEARKIAQAAHHADLTEVRAHISHLTHPELTDLVDRMLAELEKHQAL